MCSRSWEYSWIWKHCSVLLTVSMWCCLCLDVRVCGEHVAVLWDAAVLCSTKNSILAGPFACSHCLNTKSTQLHLTHTHTHTHTHAHNLIPVLFAACLSLHSEWICLGFWVQYFCSKPIKSKPVCVFMCVPKPRGCFSSWGNYSCPPCIVKQHKSITACQVT